MNDLAAALRHIIQATWGVTAAPELTRPDEQYGEYATNIALQLSKQLGKPPREIAEQIAEQLRQTAADQVSAITVAGPGFINVQLKDGVLLAAAAAATNAALTTFQNQVVVAEYSDPNPFKVLHAGHLYTSVVGDAIANLVARAGGEVHRVNFGGDVGLHVGKTMWAILQKLGGEQPEKLSEIATDQRAEWLTTAYVEGTNAYEDDESAKAAIIELNKRVYQLHAAGDHDSPFAHIYWTCRQWSYDYFDAFYARIGSKFEKYYPESEVADLGLATVSEQLKNGVYKESAGAVVFVGEPYGLHTRVFINSHDIPTYEAKDVGLIMRKWQDYHFDRSIIITGNDIVEYMKVVLKSIEQFQPELPARTTHLTHGNVKLQGGVKMSSRKGNILRAAEVLNAAAEANKTAGRDDDRTALGAVKYAFLKQRIGADIIYNPAESVSLEGNSGPYLQYAHARARSILRKAGNNANQTASAPRPTANAGLSQDLDAPERSLARKISEYPEVLERAAKELMPHHICTYLYELAQVFNRFYEQSKVIGDPRQTVRLQLVGLYAAVLKDGLSLLGIAAPEEL